MMTEVSWDPREDERGPLSINSIIVKCPLLIRLQVPILSPEFDHFPIRKLKAFVLTQILSGGLDFRSFLCTFCKEGIIIVKSNSFSSKYFKKSESKVTRYSPTTLSWVDSNPRLAKDRGELSPVSG
jgi:hypothetical protein